MLAQGKLESGEWKKIESAKEEDKEDIRITRIKKQVERLDGLWEEKLVLDESIERLVTDYSNKLLEKTRERRERMDEERAKVEPKLQSLTAKIDAIKAEDEKAVVKFRRLREKVGQFVLNYNRAYTVRKVVKLDLVVEVLQKMEKYVSPRNLQAFKDLESSLFQDIEQDEKFNITLNMDDPRNQELVEDTMKQLKKEIKTSQNTEFERDAAYKALEDLLVDGVVTFDEYNKFTDLADVNAKEVIASVKHIKANLVEVKADAIDNITTKIKDLYNSVKEWVTKALPFLATQEKEIKDINEDLDTVLED